MKLLLFCFIVILLPCTISSQNKIYLSSENDYVTVNSYDDWIVNDVNEYLGQYESVYPGQTETGEYEGDAFSDDLTISFDNSVIVATTNMNIEASWEQRDTLYNPVISGNLLTAGNGTGRFVLLKYKNLKGKVKMTFGVFIKKPDNTDYEDFYQKK